jgi:serine/threonine protein kinase
MTDWIGRTLGRVRIESLVARGGMAEVYLGTHTTLQREVAVKILRNHFEDDPRPYERFEREARAVAKLRHPNIVQVFDFDTIDGQPYIVMEYIRGPSLSKYLTSLHAKNIRLGLPHVSKLLTGVANALQYAHESGVIHRDVKPGNILLTSRSLQIVPGETIPLDFDPVLTDFGLVRFLDSSRQTTIGQTAGTPAYMSPEQAMGLTTDGRTDIYSLGIVLYEMLSGNVPFDGETTMSVLLKHLNEAPAPILGLPPALQEVLDRALAKTADDRYQDPKEFAAAFNTALNDTSDASTVLTITRVFKPTPEKKLAPAKPRNYWRPALAAGALLALASAAFLFKGVFPLPGSATPTDVLFSDTPTMFTSVSLGPTGVLQFQDGRDLLDQASLIAEAMPAPPPGGQYEVWLTNGAERLSLGGLSVDGEGRGSLIFNNPQKDNLLAGYSGIEVTVKTSAGTDANGSERVAYSYALPDAGLVYLRGLLVSSQTTPQEVGLIHGLAANANLLNQFAIEMLNNYESSDEASTRQNAESLLNLLVGFRSQDHKDWNGDGQVADPGDGYGFLLNGDNLGYIRAVYSHADYAVNASGASRNMIVNGENVKICTQNLAGWAPQLRDQLLTILNAGSFADMDSAVQSSVALVDLMLQGIDLNENGAIEPASNECGVLAAYEYTYRMADMPLLPVNPLETPIALSATVTPTPTATFVILNTPVPTRGVDDPVIVTQQPPQPPTNQPPSQPTREPRPTRQPRPTHQPQPTKNRP